MYNQLLDKIKSNKKWLLLGMIPVSLIFIIFVMLGIIIPMKKYYTSELNKIISNPETNNKQELLNFQQEARIFLSSENQRLIESEIARIEQAEIAEAKRIEEEKLAEAKKVEEQKKAEELQKQQEEKEKIANQKEKEKLVNCKISYLYTQMVVYGLEQRLLDFSQSECDRYNQVMQGIEKDGKAKFDGGMANEILDETELGCLGAYSYSKMAALKSKDPSDEIHAQLVFKFSRCDTYFSYFD